MSDPQHWSVRAPPAPRARPAEGPGAARQAGGGGDLRPRFSELLRQRKNAEPLAGDERPLFGTAFDAIEPLSEDEAQPGEEDAAAAEVELPPDQAQAHAQAQDAAMPDLAPGEPAHASQAQAAARLSPADQQQVGRMVDVVARFCNDRVVSDSEGWQVQIELRPEVLPATSLSLSISPLWLCLRFAIRDDRSRQLIMAHRQTLADQLEDALVRRREISIGFD
jgi:type III secretion control protein HpaP